MIVKKEIMDESGINRTLKRLAYEILEHNKGVDALAIVGIRDRGDNLAQRLHHLIQEIIIKLKLKQLIVMIRPRQKLLRINPVSQIFMI